MKRATKSLRASKIIFLLMLLLTLSSCFSYKPGYINSPKFEDRGELNLDLNLGSNYGANLSYSPVKHFAFLADFTEGAQIKGEGAFINQNMDSTNNYRYTDWELGLAAGTYWNYSEKLYHDLYLGFSEGKGSATTDRININIFSPDPNIKAFEGDYQNLFLQSSFKIELSEMAFLSFDMRLNFLEFSSFNYVTFQNPSGDIDRELADFFNQRNRIVSQFGITANAEMEYFKFFTQIQLGFADDVEFDFFDVRPFSFYMGISIPISQLLEK